MFSSNLSSVGLKEPREQRDIHKHTILVTHLGHIDVMSQVIVGTRISNQHMHKTVRDMIPIAGAMHTINNQHTHK
jgi:hypothetical protein